MYGLEIVIGTGFMCGLIGCLVGLKIGQYFEHFNANIRTRQALEEQARYLKQHNDTNGDQK